MIFSWEKGSLVDKLIASITIDNSKSNFSPLTSHLTSHSLPLNKLLTQFDCKKVKIIGLKCC